MTRVLLAFGEAVAAPEVVWSLRDAGVRPALLCRRGSITAARHLRDCEVIDVTPPEPDALRCRADIEAAVVRTGAVGVMPLDDAGLLIAGVEPPSGERNGSMSSILVEPRVPMPAAEFVPATVGAAAASRGRAEVDADGHGRSRHPAGGLARSHPRPDDRRPALRVLGPSGATARLALDKHRQFELARAAGFAVPPTVTDPADALRLGSGAAIVKPLLAGRIADGRLVRDGAIRVTDGGTAAAELGARADASTRFAAQPVVPGTGEGIFGIAIHGEARLLSAHRRVRMMHPAGSGSSACRSIDVDPALGECTRRFCRDANWHGLFMIEVLRDDDGVAWFMELNGRPWGSMALARRRGLEYPALHAQAFLHGIDPDALPEIAGGPHLTCRHLGREAVHLAIVMRGTSEAIAGWPRRLRTLRDLLVPARGTRWYHADAREPGYLFRDAWATVRSRLGRRDHRARTGGGT